MAKLVIILIFYLFYPINSYSNIQFYKEDVEFIFELNNHKKIFIVRQGNINSIFEYDNKSKKFQYFHVFYSFFISFLIILNEFILLYKNKFYCKFWFYHMYLKYKMKNNLVS